MRRITLLVFVISHVLCANSIGSELPDSSFIWTIRSIGWGQCQDVSTYMISGDTIIGNKVYKQILTTPDSIYSESNSSYYCATRDSAGIWFFVPDGKSEEYLLYNFNASTGDTITINNPWTVGEVDAYLVSKDSVFIEDEYKTRIGIGFRPGEFWEYWIEDIGCMSGLFYSCFFIADIGYELSCTYLNGVFYHNFGFSEICGCWPKTSIESFPSDSQVSIYPNPSKGIFNVENLFPESLTIYFYSLDGKLIEHMGLDSNGIQSVKLEHTGNIIVRIEGGEIHSTQIIQVIK